MHSLTGFDLSSRDRAGVSELPCGAAQASPTAEARGSYSYPPNQEVEIRKDGSLLSFSGGLVTLPQHCPEMLCMVGMRQLMGTRE